MFRDRVAVITGASSGIGACLARSLSEKRAKVILFARSADKLEKLGSQLPGDWQSFSVDVSVTEQVFSAVEEVMERYGRIDILINNAGFGVFRVFVETPLEYFEEMMAVNYLGTVRCTKAVLPHMLKQGEGCIVNIASLAGKVATAKSTAYSASKHAVLGFTDSLRQELKGTGVKVISVNPGPVDTPFFDRADPTGNYVKSMERFMLKPEEVAEKTLDAIARGKEEVNLPRTLALGAKIYRLFPRTCDRLLYRIINRK